MSDSTRHDDKRPLIGVRNGTKRFSPRKGGRTVTALEDLNLSIQAEEFVCVVGPSGCGKSTLLRVIAGLTPLTSGSVVVNDQPVTKPRTDVGIVFQNPVLLPWRTARKNVLLPAEVMGLGPEAEERADMLLDMVGLGSFKDSYPHELSGGMRQRVSIARALLSDPAILLMDEPFGALDALTRQQMNAELERIWESDRKTVLLITHDVNEAVFLGDRVLVMSNRPGRVTHEFHIDLGRPRELSATVSAEFSNYVWEIQQALGVWAEIGERSS